MLNRPGVSRALRPQPKLVGPSDPYVRYPTPTGFAEIISDYFPILHPVPGNRTHDYAGGFELRIRVRERQATLDLHAQ